MVYSELEKIVSAYPNKSWDFYLLSQNPNISQSFIDEHPEIPWNKEFRYYNPNIPESFIDEHPEMNWDFKILSTFHHLSTFFIEKYIIELWDYDLLSMHPNIDFHLVKSTPYCSWNYEIICSQAKFIHFNMYKHNPDFPWSKIYLVQNPNITWENVMESDLNEYAAGFSHNPNITIEIINNHPDISWDWSAISRTIQLDETLLRENKPWDYYWLSSNPSLTWKMVDNQKEKPWDLYYIFANFHISEKSIDFFINEKNRLLMDWWRISFHRNVPLHVLDKFKHYIVWEYIGYNQNLTLDFIQKNEELFTSYDCLSYNLFDFKEEQKQKQDYYYYCSTKSRCIEKTKKIEEELIQVTWHPSRFMDWCLDNEEKEELSYTFA